MKPKILVVTINFPFPPGGACAADRASGILQLIRLGFDVKVITMIKKPAYLERVDKFSKELGIEIVPVSYKFHRQNSKIEKFKKYIRRIVKNPLILDGAAAEFSDEEVKKVLKTKIEEWHPGLVWFDYSYTWPLYDLVKSYKVPVVSRSLNFEPTHFLEENGRNPINYLRFCVKFISEIMTARKSDIVFSINPREERIYKRLGAKIVATLPLRGLPSQLNKNRTTKDKDCLNVFFIGSSYNIPHMRKALFLILNKVAPEISRIAPNRFRFHIFGGDFPEELYSYTGENVIYRGYVEDLDGALGEMDIALIPSFHIAGMQQKVFESLVRGFPTITYRVSLAGYKFENEKNVLLASNADEFVSQLIKLQDINIRRQLSEGSLDICSKLFSQETVDSIILREINKFLK